MLKLLSLLMYARVRQESRSPCVLFLDGALTVNLYLIEPVEVLSLILYPLCHWRVKSLRCGSLRMIDLTNAHGLNMIKM